MAQAQSLLESALGLDKLDLAPRLFYERPYADVETAGRCDAEYFQPAHEAVIECCKQYKHGWISLDDLMASITNGVECREFVEDGVPYLRVGDIDGLLLKPSEAKQIARADADTLRPKIALEPGDIVMVRSGSIGQTAVISDNTRDSILSSHLIRLRQTKPMRVRPLCLALMLSSLIGVEQTKKHNNGAIVPEVSQSAVRQFIVPLLHNGLQNDIEKHIQASHDAAKEAHRLLDEAKRRVEEAILR
uniref:Type I restriction enzyme M protein n=1 Tax=Candidatus Kentrum sp. TC TaxID=2126339 RepID=A0A450ZHG9_9GAMM|nr:MAG: type I restriction enzyme M protein [Candidatus Kentron sp. TC]